MKEADSCETSKPVNRKLFRSQLVDLPTSCKADILIPDVIPSCEMASNAGESQTGTAIGQACCIAADTASTYQHRMQRRFSRSGGSSFCNKLWCLIRIAATCDCSNHIMDGTGHLVTSSTSESQAMCTRIASEGIDHRQNMQVADCCDAVIADVEDKDSVETFCRILSNHPRRGNACECVNSLRSCKYLLQQYRHCVHRHVHLRYFRNGYRLSSRNCSGLCPSATCDLPALTLNFRWLMFHC